MRPSIAYALIFLTSVVVLPAPVEAEPVSGPISVNQFMVTDGDTIRMLTEEKGTRLVGYNAPETAERACVPMN